LTYNTNFSHEVDNRSILDVNIESIPSHDVLVGGFPCQPFSYAGKRRGLVDDRGMLFFALVEDLYVNSPKFFIFENVKGLATHDSGKTLSNVKQAIKDAGYRLSYAVLNADDFLCPQSRHRLITD
jgi:DNA (cytosine-5)-methyltransferase 1